MRTTLGLNRPSPEGNGEQTVALTRLVVPGPAHPDLIEPD